MRTSVKTLAAFAAATLVVSSAVAFKPLVEIVKVSPSHNGKVPLSNKLKAEKSVKDAEIGKPIDMSCTVADDIDIEVCSWRRQDGPELFVVGADIVDASKNKIEGISVNQSNSR